MKIMKNLQEKSRKYTFTICYVLIMFAFAGLFYSLMSAQTELAAEKRTKINLMQSNIELMEGNKNLAEALNALIPLAQEQKKLIIKQRELINKQREIIELLIEKLEDLKGINKSRNIA